MRTAVESHIRRHRADVGHPLERKETIAPRLKPALLRGLHGTVETVPLQRSDFPESPYSEAPWIQKPHRGDAYGCGIPHLPTPGRAIRLAPLAQARLWGTRGGRRLFGTAEVVPRFKSRIAVMPTVVESHICQHRAETFDSLRSLRPGCGASGTRLFLLRGGFDGGDGVCQAVDRG